MKGEVKNLPKWAVELPEALPHGSGIDANWKITGHDGYIRCDNSFHCMNENGYYDGWADFSAILRHGLQFDDEMDVIVHFRGNHSYRKAEKYILREYLVDTIAENLRDFEWGKGLRKVLRARDAEMLSYRIQDIQHKIQPHVISGEKSFVDLSEAMDHLGQILVMLR